MAEHERKLRGILKLPMLARVFKRRKGQLNKANHETDKTENDKKIETDHRLSEELEISHLDGKISCALKVDQLDKAKNFMPRGCIDTLITEDIVARLLTFSALSKEESSNVVKFVMDAPAKKIFAIAIRSVCTIPQLSNLLNQCFESNFCDTDLPITDENRHKIAFFDRMNKEHEFARWTNTFEDYQWDFEAPAFSNDEPDITLSPKAPLPFVHFEKDVGSGGFGAVHKVIVHEAHRDHSAFHVSENTGEAALKRMDRPEHVEGGSLQEAQALKDLSHKHIIEFIAVIHKEPNNYLMLRWANGGDLQNYWEKKPDPRLSASFVKSVFTQFHGLIHALNYIHTFPHGTYRHTDIKPANILRIVDNHELQNGQIGVLKISDLGLAKKHTKPTSLRRGTVARATTYRYQPPEAAYELTQEGIGRRYDIWSMGCVMMELIIWLLHGTKALNEFSTWRGKDSHNRDVNPFFKPPSGDFLEVHSVVSSIIEQLLEDQECQANTAMGDLLRLVKDKMLVVALKNAKRHGRTLGAPSREPKQRQYRTDSSRIRAYSGEVLEDMDKIMGHTDDDSYWFSGQCRENAAPLRDPRPPEPNEEVVSDESTEPGSPTIGFITADDGEAPLLPQPPIPALYINDQPDSLNDRWEFPIDNNFAAHVLEGRDAGQWFPSKSRTRLCGTCKSYDFTTFPFTISDTKSELEEKQATCDFCNMRWNLSKAVNQTSGSIIRFEREGSVLRLDGNQPPVLAICRGPGKRGPHDSRIQMGFPQVPSLLDEMSFHIIREWYKQEIDFNKLPATFQHAITITRKIGQQYIWIDSLCIIQGPGGDFDQEAPKMETIFSSAYCVLSASSSHGQYDGFLMKPKQNRDYLIFEREGLSPLYICRFIDDFGNDVLHSNLSRRGWAFQERALARRTVYFTNAQMYWECGNGVRCQSLAKMNNDLASFLGDPNFPSKLSDGSSRRGEKILFYEDLYCQYSRLDFTRKTDRAVAILGLERRLICDLQARGGFGVFDDGRSLLQHSLLWKRGKEVATLTRIDFGLNRAIPSWSWMAYNEGIDFLDLPLGDVKWLRGEIISPWADPSGEMARGTPEISILARKFTTRRELTEDSVDSIVYDSPDRVQRQAVRCVLMGKIGNRGTSKKEDLIYCVLFVQPQKVAPGTAETYERVGVGFLAAKVIDLDSPGVLLKLR
ncbi:hypothetical protein S7711_03513 [Stachybotrys chartarum IBT 7711]|uniref:Protein kinase domain-containing protein n=1 Tax=Stachybotrys chartarum (strain CBS 109288 / IBT 7711) TaxID=1280523 RepID=A0A084AFZ9_STACB|nr:hypothetical protein S7711_03513 [Stachybotrys chartarum IBT 7711]